MKGRRYKTTWAAKGSRLYELLEQADSLKNKPKEMADVKAQAEQAYQEAEVEFVKRYPNWRPHGKPADDSGTTVSDLPR